MAVLSKERIAEIRQMLDIGSKDFEFMRDALAETLDAHDYWLKAVRECQHVAEVGGVLACVFCAHGTVAAACFDYPIKHADTCPWLLSQEGK